ncbi:hypothetical protein BDU57DRAFT_312053 [Ampelomyces quisqualis]|uniref:Uncharacterized protein n=1 Tax=Ampelomyces quisqualis TaxID=50730 RepID=A0A6A5QCZ4_AMPQU|nr:hypothetical protein BDU57DRAFT_312053 [Ampelomyces quisqualis]
MKSLCKHAIQYEHIRRELSTTTHILMCLWRNGQYDVARVTYRHGCPTCTTATRNVNGRRTPISAPSIMAFLIAQSVRAATAHGTVTKPSVHIVCGVPPLSPHRRRARRFAVKLSQGNVRRTDSARDHAGPILVSADSRWAKPFLRPPSSSAHPDAPVSFLRSAEHSCRTTHYPHAGGSNTPACSVALRPGLDQMVVQLDTSTRFMNTFM